MPPAGTTFVVEDAYAELNELGAWRGALRVDAGVAEFQAQLATLLLWPTAFELFETLVPFPAAPPARLNHNGYMTILLTG